MPNSKPHSVSEWFPGPHLDGLNGHPEIQHSLFRILLHRLSTGYWTGKATNPASLNKKAAALGPKFNVFLSNGQVVPTAPAFIHFTPPLYLRPFNLGDPIP